MSLKVHYSADGPENANDLAFCVPLKDAGQYWVKPSVVSPADLQPFNPRIGAKEWVIYRLVNHVLDRPGCYGGRADCYIHFYVTE